VPSWAEAAIFNLVIEVSIFFNQAPWVNCN
jgi:hypothetical protein